MANWIQKLIMVLMAEILLMETALNSGVAEAKMGMMGGGGGNAGVMHLLAAGLIAKLLQDMKNQSNKMGQGHTTKIVPLPVYLGHGGMMNNDWMMHGMMGGMD